jgi:hypothetical protein
LNNLWHTQNVISHKWLIESIKLRLTDQFKQNWHSTLQISPKALSYRLFKSDFRSINFDQNDKIFNLTVIFRGYLPSSPYNIKFGVEVFKLSNSLQNFTCTFLNKGRIHNLSVSCHLDLFDKISIPMLTYGSEIWGYENIDILEKVHVKFCKLLLNLKTSTPNFMLYGELGRYPHAKRLNNHSHQVLI